MSQALQLATIEREYSARTRGDRTITSPAAPCTRSTSGTPDPSCAFDRVLDVFGDGPFWAIATRRTTSPILCMRGDPVLVTGDAAAYHAPLAHRIRPVP